MYFQRPLWGLCAIFVTIVLIWLFKERAQSERSFFKHAFARGRISFIPWIRALLIVTTLCIATSLTDPTLNQKSNMIFRGECMTVSLLIDASKSMDAEDASQKRPRLLAAVDFARQIVAACEHGAFEVITYLGARVPVVRVPTKDHGVLLYALEHWVTDSEQRKMSGSDLVFALERFSYERFEAPLNMSKAIFGDAYKQLLTVEPPKVMSVVVFSDGGMEGSIEALETVLVKILAYRGIDFHIHTVGFGDVTPTTIPVYVKDEKGPKRLTGVIRKDNLPVMTVFDPKPLKRIAAQTGGVYVHERDTGSVGRIVQALRLPSVDTAHTIKDNSISYTREFLLASMISLGVLLTVMVFWKKKI